jgi:tetratricopeptide (TPR) repeat protein
MKRYFPLVVLAAFTLAFATTGFQCGSAEVTTAKLAMQQQQWDKAEMSLLKEVTKNEKNEEAWFMLGQVRWEMKKYTEGNEAFGKALGLSETHRAEITKYRLEFWQRSINEGVQHYNSGRSNPAEFEVAAARFKDAIDVIPDSANGHYYLALAHMGKKDYAAAEASLNAALARKPDYREALDRLASVQVLKADEARQAGDKTAETAALEKASEIYGKAHKAYPADADYILALIDIYEKLGQSDKALVLTRDAVAADPTNRIFRYAYGVFLLKQEEFGPAIEQLEKVGNAQGDTADVLTHDATYNLGVAYLNWGVAMKAEADKNAEAARISKKKDFKEDQSFREKLKAALPYLEKAAEVRQDDAALWSNLGRLYANLNMVEKSKSAFERSDKLLKGK